MNRRKAIKNMGLAAGFTALAPSFLGILQSCTPSETPWVPKFLTSDEKTVLTHLVNVILPKTESLPSGLELNVPQFIDQYIFEILNKKDQKHTREAFTQVIEKLKPTPDGNLKKIEPDSYKAFLDKHMRVKGEIDEERKAQPNAEMLTTSEILNQIKWLSIKAYLTTEQIGEEVLPYDPVPAAYYCGDLQELTGGKSWSL